MTFQGGVVFFLSLPTLTYFFSDVYCGLQHVVQMMLSSIFWFYQMLPVLLFKSFLPALTHARMIGITLADSLCDCINFIDDQIN